GTSARAGISPPLHAQNHRDGRASQSLGGGASPRQYRDEGLYRQAARNDRQRRTRNPQIRKTLRGVGRKTGGQEGTLSGAHQRGLKNPPPRGRVPRYQAWRRKSSGP